MDRILSVPCSKSTVLCGGGVLVIFNRKSASADYLSKVSQFTESIVSHDA